MGRLRRIGLALLVVVAVLVAWEPTRVGIQTAVMLPNLLGSPVRPLDWFSDAPQRTSIAYRPETPGVEGDLAELWLPAWASADRRAGGILLVLGVNNVGRNHPVVARVAEGLARSGAAVLVPDSRTLLEGRLEIGEIDGVVRAFEALLARPEVDPLRAGIAGFSVGGSLALLAAGDARIADDVRWVNAFGAYADAETYLASVAAHAYRGSGGARVDWEPSPLAREVYLQFVLDQVDEPRDRAALEDALGPAVLAGGRPEPDPTLRASLMTDSARTAHDLLSAPDLDAARAAIGMLPASSLAFIDAISPIRHLPGLRADVFVMHETTDHHVPFVESRSLVAALERAGVRVRSASEFRLFDHVQPDELDLIAAAPELVRLLLHVRTLMEETL
jgi:dienelactone hydrolase